MVADGSMATLLMLTDLRLLASLAWRKSIEGQAGRFGEAGDGVALGCRCRSVACGP
jgi:hypothetical protein